MASKDKQIQALVNGERIKTTRDGWNPAEVGRFPVLLAGWAPGKASHHPISLGVAIACKDKVPDVFLGNFEAEDDKGNAVEVPVIDPLKLNEAMYNAFIEKYDLDVQTIRIAGNRAAARQELDSTYEALANTPEVMDVLKTTNPALYEKLSARVQPEEEEDSDEEEDDEQEE